MLTTDLPAPLAEPLHLLQPSPWPDRLLLLGILLLLGLLARWLLGRRRSVPGRPTPVATPSPVVPVLDARGTIDEIRQRYDVFGKYRDGCHALAEAIRRHFAEAGHASKTWTAADVAKRTEDQALRKLVWRLAEVRFGRREPERREFRELCDLTDASLTRSSTAREEPT